ncbi:sporulation protein Cse60 [Lactobacillus taiwanensis]|uniref:sporulation protein Cse60 n=1 Tax=Lactobacillus taiwanensis TaxID=508451 RepID=UPI0025AF2C0D|nr:sporulation protein Cse60 [Lactobacillus taiwanensis]
MIIHELKILSEEVGVLGETIVMKVKTIANMREDWFDDEINEFIQHKHIVDIKFSVLFDSNDDNYIFSALITYEEIGI